MTLSVVVVLLAIICFIIQAFVWLYFFSTLQKTRIYKNESIAEIPVSVIICARNESQNLRKNLPSILQQQYPTFEVIVVDHASNDNTQDVISEMSGKYDRIHYVRCEDPVPSKRAALLLGLSTSRYQHVLVTDADCRPESNDWIRKMMEPFSCGYDIIVAAAPLSGDRKILSCFVKSEAALIFLQYAAATISGLSYMGVGRNMGYVKRLYPTDLLKSNDQYLGGDDDLFVSSQHKRRIALVNDRDAVVWSEGPTSWSRFYQKKHRHVSVSWAYTWWQKIYVAIFSFSHWGFLILTLVMIMLNIQLSLALIMITIKVGFSILILKKVAGSFVYNCSVLNLVISEFIYLVHYPLIAWYLTIKPPEKW